MRELEDALVALRRGEAVDLSRPGALGLVAADGRPTRLGEEAAYHASEFAWQSAYDPLEGLLVPPPLSQTSRILDLGCGSGQTLRRLFPNCGATLVGVDCALDMLAFGSKLFESYSLPAVFCCASAHALPFPDDTFDFVVCRTAINYTQQACAIAEAFRVSRPGAPIFFRVENWLWDLNVLSQPRSLLGFLFDLRSLGVGLLHALSGYQPNPGGILKGPRAYVSQRRFRATVRRVGGELVAWESSRRGPQVMGRGTQDVVLCRKPGR